MTDSMYSRPSLLALLGLAFLAQPAQAQAPGKPVSACNRAAFRAIIDVGHTLEDPGATSARGYGEYQFNLTLARAIEQKLTADGFVRTVLLITSGPARAGLMTRVRNANAMQGDLFLSIHHDSVPEGFLETWDYNGQSNHFSDRFNGHSLFVSFDHPQHNASLLFGKFLGNQLKAHDLQYTRHYTEAIMGSRRRDLVDPEAGVYRYDQLIVLRQTTMPAVLLEAGVIVNRNAEQILATAERHTVIASAVSAAIDQFCDWREREKAKLLEQAKRVKAPAKRP